MQKDNETAMVPLKRLTVSDLKRVVGGFGASPNSLKGEDSHGSKLEIKQQ
jgi:hypothetical protein